MNTIRNTIKNTFNIRASRKRQRGVTVVEMLVVIGIMGVITPALTLVILTLMATPQGAHANLTTSRDANFAAAVITEDASCADEWIPEPDPVGNPDNYGIFRWRDMEGCEHSVLYHYDAAEGALMRQETVGGVAGYDIVIAMGLSAMEDVTFDIGEPDDPSDDDTALFMTIYIKVSMNDAQGDAVEVEKTFRAWMRAAVAVDTWGFRRAITIQNDGTQRLTDYPMLLDLTGAVGDGGLQWDIWEDIDENGLIIEDGSDLRFVRHAEVFELPITITDPADDHHVRVEIDAADGVDDTNDQRILNNMAPNYDGADIRFFSEQLSLLAEPNDDPYLWDEQDGYPRADWEDDYDKLHHWVQERTETSFIAWVKVPDSDMTEIYMYYGDPMQEDESSVEYTFTDAQFTDSFDDLALIGDSDNVIVASGEVQIDVDSALLGDPSFEDGVLGASSSADWTFARNSNNFFGAFSDEYPFDNVQCYKLSKGATWDFNGRYGQISQAVDLSNVSAITFDANMTSACAGKYVMRVYIVDTDLNTNTVKTYALPSSATDYEDQTIDLTTTGDDRYIGNCTIIFRVTSQNLGLFDNGYSFSCYLDNIRLTQWGWVASDPIPDDAAARFAVGDELSWNHVSGSTTRIVYRVQYTDDGGTSWQLIPDADLPGNAAGFTLAPIDVSTIYPDYEQVRLLAYLYTDDDAITPALEDWTLDYFSRNGSQAPDTTYDEANELAVSTAEFELLAFYLDEDTDDEPGDTDGDGVWDPDSGENDGRGTVKIWVKVSYIPVGTSTIWVYYGNPNAGMLPDGETNSCADSKYTTWVDFFDDDSKVDWDASQHVQVSNGQVEVVTVGNEFGDSTIIENPSFESGDGGWSFFDSEDDLRGEYSGFWKTDGAEAVRFRSLPAGEDEEGWGPYLVWRHNYAEVVQSIDFSDIETLEFDANLWQEAQGGHWGYFLAQVRIGGTTYWSVEPPSAVGGTEYIGETIDVSGITGVQTLSFRIYCETYRFFFFWLPFTWRMVDCQFDNIRTYSYEDDIYLYSESIPVDGSVTEAGEGATMSWNDDPGDGEIVYHVEYYDEGTGAWELLPDGVLPGNSGGTFRTGGQQNGRPTPPIEFQTNTAWWENKLDDQDEIKVRLMADIEHNWGTLPTIDDWRISLGSEASSVPYTTGTIGEQQVANHELPISVYNELVGQGENPARAEYDLDHSPVVQGSETIYVNGAVVNCYTMNYATGHITFDAGEEPHVNKDIHADYLYDG